ncbi:extracellular solute-binding protein [Actinocatenispora sera]|uniref:extracellular solute-binding protein n=1 Tax=Actinocatenispora sera TaxID=390989 RepID=UPI0034048AB3
MRFRKLATIALTGAVIAPLLAACGSSGDSKNEIKIAYQRSTDNNSRIMDNFLAGVKKQFEKANPGKTVKLIPIQATENDYYTKLDLMMKSPRTAPDLAYEDTFLINSDIKAGFLRPIDAQVKSWDQWSQFQDAAKESVTGQDGKVYGVPDGTDTRGIWYDKQVFAKAGLPANWEPKSWNDLLSAARQIKKKVPGVTPMNLYTGKAGGEASSMQGFEMLLYGTADQLYNPQEKKWVVGSKGFQDSMNFLKTVYSTGLGPKPSQALDANISTNVNTDWFPNAKIGFSIDGSWTANNWISTGPKPWKDWTKNIGWTAMPTQNGQAPGKTSMSGGWSWAITKNAKNPTLAWKFVTAMQTEKNAVTYDNAAQNIAVRKDVAADPKYQNSSPTVKFFTDLVAVTHYRPAYAEYPKVSTAIQEQMEAVTTGTSSPAKASADYDKSVADIVGNNTTKDSGPAK